MVDTKHADMDKPIVGHEIVVPDGDRAFTPIPSTSPKTMMPAEKTIHDLTHLPYHPGCPH